MTVYPKPIFEKLEELSELQSLIDSIRTAIKEANSLAALDHIRIQALGKRAQLTRILKNVRSLAPDDRPRIGQAVNQAKQVIQTALEKRLETLKAIDLKQKLACPTLDVTLPGRGEQLGSCHPLSTTQSELEQLFIQIGFNLMTGPEIEDEQHNFTALNIPLNHPARALHDTFYLEKDRLLRTHTSTIQIRALKQYPPPLYLIASGRVYRRDFDVTHTPMFHQLEGLAVYEQANFSELKGLLTQFLQIFFKNPQLPTRFRASYFPFTEPSAEVDVQCVLCAGKGCPVCSHTGWLEVLGCGMVHPRVLIGAGLDAERYQGYAFGMGIDRLTALRFGIPDLRMLFENDLRFLTQF